MTPDEGVLLWSLRGNGRDVRCMCRRISSGLELRVLWGDELFLTESFRDHGRLERRAHEFKATLESRGWRAIEPEARSSAVAPAEPDSPAPPVAERPAGFASACSARQPRVLVVDDEPSIRTFLRRYLHEAGYIVSEAADVDGALNALDQDPVDAIVLDVRLPDARGWGRTGLEVLAFVRLHKAFSPLPVLVLTGRSVEPEEQDLIRRHRADLFMKPDGYQMVLARLNELTGGHAAQ